LEKCVAVTIDLQTNTMHVIAYMYLQLIALPF